MTDLWLVRHGQTDWNVEGRYQGQSDVPLNEAGRQQARDLAARLAGQHFEAVYSSDLARARETAEIVAAALGLPVRLDRRLREICQGEWEGLQVKDISGRFVKDVAHARENPLHSRAPGGESVGEVAARMAVAASDIAREHPGGRVLVFSHGLAVSTLFCQAHCLSLAEAYQHIPENGTPIIVQI